jgi:uridine kinase
MPAQNRTSLVVGIAGGSCSGKTTLSARMVEALADVRTEVIHMDRYFLKVKPQMVAPVTRKVYPDHNHPTSFDLAGLVHDLDALRTAEGAPELIIVEGLMTLHDEDIRSRLDLKLFIDCQSDERIVRRIKRGLEHGGDMDSTAAFYLDTVRYRYQEFVEPSRWQADLVLSGSTVSALGMQVVVDWVRRAVEARRDD